MGQASESFFYVSWASIVKAGKAFNTIWFEQWAFFKLKSSRVRKSHGETFIAWNGDTIEAEKCQVG